jgi:hypothetical protein
MSEEELIETLKEFKKSRVDKLKEPSRNLFYAIMKITDERDKYKEVLDKIKEDLIKTKKYNKVNDNNYINIDLDHLDYLLEILEEIE